MLCIRLCNRGCSECVDETTGSLMLRYPHGEDPTVGLRRVLLRCRTGTDTVQQGQRSVQHKNFIMKISRTVAQPSPARYAQRMQRRVPSGDKKLIQIVDAALEDTARRSQGWLVCRKGCTTCCIGVFPINQLDVARLQRGLQELQLHDPQRAEAIRQRAREAVERLSRDFPGNPKTGLLGETTKERERFETFGNHEPCPALDLDEGTCDLYKSRPMTCRVFGPPVRVEAGGLGVCELCYQAASEQEVAACEMIPDPQHLEPGLVKQVEKTSGRHGDTIIAFCLAA